MAVSVIEQDPLHDFLPVGQEIIFVVSNNDAVNNNTKVKFIAEVHISTSVPNLATTTDLIGTFKTTPNNAKVGIFDFRNVVENYLKADHIGYFDDSVASEYKGVDTTSVNRHPLHLIDKYSLNNDSVRFLGINFMVEYADANGVVSIDADTAVDSQSYLLFNGYLKYTDSLDLSTSSLGTYAGCFGYNLSKFGLNGSTRQFLSNAPATQYANLGDYGTIAFLNWNLLTPYLTSYMTIKYYNSAGDLLDQENVYNNAANGGSTGYTDSHRRMIFFGCFPGNLENWSATFASNKANLSYYTVQAKSAAADPISQIYTINIKCKDLKNYEPIRLCWLNQWGAWDYYTFTKKSSRTYDTSRTTYTQLQGTWNEAKYRVDSHRGGKKTFTVNSVEKIKINTDFVTEGENVMFEEMTNSPEVYLLEGYQEDQAFPMLNQYVTPVRITSKSFTRKTVANDSLLQYTFDIEKTKTLRTQKI